MNESDRMMPKDWLDWTSTQQGLASDPARSAWVSANAGSGKTHVLTQRVIRLLLAGCRPSAILCLTYTKAAASEMSNRVFERLAEWAILDDDELARRIAEIERREPDAIQLQEARRLFARALETPGGLKIQTIHAFCEALLHQFPLEANVAGHFSVLDDRAAAELMEDARRSLLLAGSRGAMDRWPGFLPRSSRWPTSRDWKSCCNPSSGNEPRSATSSTTPAGMAVSIAPCRHASASAQGRRKSRWWPPPLPIPSFCRTGSRR